MAEKETVEVKVSPASFKELVEQKRKAGLTRDQAENVARRQLERDAEEARKAKAEKKA